MATRNFGRRQQIWVAIFFFVVLFAATIWTLDGMTSSLFWRIMVVSASCVILCVGLFDFWLRRDVARRESGFQLLDRISAGDLSLSGREILLATHSRRMSSALRALVLNLERTIRRFGHLANDVSRVTEQMSVRSRVLARSASEQLASTESTSTSVTQIDQSINAVRTSMEGLSGNAEE